MCRYQVRCFGRELTSFATEADAIQVVNFLISYNLPCVVIVRNDKPAKGAKVSATKSLEDLLILVTDLKRSLVKIKKTTGEWHDKSGIIRDCD